MNANEATTGFKVDQGKVDHPVRTTKGIYFVVGMAGGAYGWKVYSPAGDLIGHAGGYTHLATAKNGARAHSMGLDPKKATRKGVR